MVSFLLLAALFLAALGFFVWYVVAAPASQVLGKTLVCGLVGGNDTSPRNCPDV